ncbi:MAG: hypothetical protein ABI051_12820 [Vicinamibacterales bacterium]
MLGTLHPEDVPRLVRKFRRDPDEHCFHTYRELILGVHLRACGWNLRYEQSLGGKTPDWVLIDEGGQVAEILDVVTLHQRRVVDSAIAGEVSSHRPWVGWVSTSPDRLFEKLREKANAYASLAAELHLPYVVALFGEFTAPIEPFEVHHVLHELHGGVFAAMPTVAGTLFFRERLGQYEYHHFTNSQATHKSQIIRG